MKHLAAACGTIFVTMTLTSIFISTLETGRIKTVAKVINGMQSVAFILGCAALAIWWMWSLAA